jgi:methylthioribose-1-phosphate isomerase
VRLAPEGCAVANFGFDVTPARLVTSLVTERGTCPATAAGLAGLFPEHAAATAA